MNLKEPEVNVASLRKKIKTLEKNVFELNCGIIGLLPVLHLQSYITCQLFLF